MNPTSHTNQTLLEGICHRGVLVATSVRYWRGCKRLNPEDLGLDPAHVSDRLTTFIDSFRSLNFAGDQQLEQTLERFRRDLLTRSAEDYRNDSAAMGSLTQGLTQGLTRLRENAVQLARNDARELVSRFGQMGSRRLAAVG